MERLAALKEEKVRLARENRKFKLDKDRRLQDAPAEAEAEADMVRNAAREEAKLEVALLKIEHAVHVRKLTQDHERALEAAVAKARTRALAEVEANLARLKQGRGT